jgi:thiosulfate reductase cytochrome b subunit
MSVSPARLEIAETINRYLSLRSPRSLRCPAVSAFSTKLFWALTEPGLYHAGSFGCRPSNAMVHPHPRWVRISHWIVALSVLTLSATGFVILMSHPRLYWGEAGNDLTPALIDLPISRNYRHGGWGPSTPFFTDSAGPASANRMYNIFNENGWGRSLHFLAAWFLILPGAAYLLMGIFGGHFRAHIWPEVRTLTPRLVWRDFLNHLRLKVPAATGGPQYGPLQKCAYSSVVFVGAPLMALTGLTMSPAVTAAFPWLLRVFGGYQSARTIHFAVFVALVLFIFVHVVMVAMSGFRHQMRAMTIGD